MMDALSSWEVMAAGSGSNLANSRNSAFSFSLLLLAAFLLFSFIVVQGRKEEEEEEEEEEEALVVGAVRR